MKHVVMRLQATLCMLLLSCIIAQSKDFDEPMGYKLTVSESRLRSQLSDWMGLLSDSTKFINLLLPASHDAATDAFVSLPDTVKPHLQCQSADIRRQFAAGARGFDIRVGDDLRLYHSVAATNHTFDEAMNDICRLLKEHPSETVVMLLKRENGGKGKYQQWLQAVVKHINERIGDRLVKDFSPSTTLGQMRGKCLLISREDFNTDSSTKGKIAGGVFATWTDNPKWSYESFSNYPSCGSYYAFYLQDCYEKIDCMGKVELVKNDLRMSDRCVRRSFPVIFYASLAGRPADNARLINPAVLAFLRTKEAPCGHGLFFMDFLNSKDERVGEELTFTVVAQNFRIF